MKTKKNILAILMTGILFLQGIQIFAQNDANIKANRSNTAVTATADEGNDSQSLTGSWSATVTPAGGDSFQALLTFGKEGTVVGSAQGDVLLNPPPGVAPGATPVHGAWKKTGNSYLFTIRQIFYGADGSFQGGNKVRNSVSLSSKGNVMTGQYQFELTDASGNVVYSGTGTIQATRIHVEPLTP